MHRFPTVAAALGIALSVIGCRSVHGAAILEDHSTTWTAAGMNKTIARAYDNALPDELFQRVLEEALVFEAHEKAERAKAVQGGAYMHGKGGTYWRKLFNTEGELQKPRFAIEAAIQMIYMQDIGMLDKHPRVAGGEWWVQKRRLGEDIGFHHDKDEALASLKMTMKFPEISTVTYLTERGAPTLIFNQTTPDGNGEVPVVPEIGMLSYPKQNRHLLFRGNLQHGVPGELTPTYGADAAVSLRGTSGVRITFLINWWNEKPLGPNCNAIDTKMIKELGLYDKEGIAQLMSGSAVKQHAVTHTAATQLPIPANPSMVTRHEVELAGSDLLWYQLPKEVEPAVHKLEFAQGQMLANVCRMSERTARILHHEQRHKVLVLVHGKGDEFIETVGRVAIDYTEHFKFVITNAQHFTDVMSMFQLKHADLPTAVIHKTFRGDSKYAMPRATGASHRAGVSEESLRDMIERFRTGKLPPVGGHDLDDDEL